MRRNLILAAAVIVVVMVSALLVLRDIPLPNREGFAIYLTEKDISPADMPTLSQVEIAEHPFVSMDDVISYNAQSHELKLLPSAYQDISDLEIPVSGRSFVVCVDRKPIYWGAFWTPISSMSFDGVTIWRPSSSEETDIITLELGYPSASFYEGEDPRSDPHVLESLEDAGKLITELSIEAVDELPHSMKGYELYSWLEDGQWHFTLITGTNRNKWLEEVVSSENFISETGWVKVHVVGVGAIKAVLARLREGESVLWLSGLRGQTLEGNASITLPGESIVDSLRAHALGCGLEFAVLRLQ